MYDEDLANQMFRKKDLSDILYFADYIRKNTGYKVFHSSSCNIANDVDYGCAVKLYKYDSDLCCDCMLNDKYALD